MAAVAPGRQHVREEARLRPRQRFRAGIEEAALDEPPDEVPAADAPRRPRRAAAGEDDLATGLVQFLRELAAGLAAADHEHGAVGKRLRRAVVVRRQPQQAPRQRPGGSWEMRPSVGAGRDHEDVGGEVAARTSAARSRRPRVSTPSTSTPSRSGRAGGVALEVADDLVPQHEPVRVEAVVRAARQLHGPVRRHETEAVPAVAPGLADPATLEHGVLDAEAGQLVAHCKPGLAAADDRHANVLHPREPTAGDVSPSGGVDTVCRR